MLAGAFYFCKYWSGRPPVSRSMLIVWIFLAPAFLFLVILLVDQWRGGHRSFQQGGDKSVKNTTPKPRRRLTLARLERSPLLSTRQRHRRWFQAAKWAIGSLLAFGAAVVTVLTLLDYWIQTSPIVQAPQVSQTFNELPFTFTNPSRFSGCMTSQQFAECHRQLS
jgi:hypothetical protein